LDKNDRFYDSKYYYFAVMIEAMLEKEAMEIHSENIYHCFYRLSVFTEIKIDPKLEPNLFTIFVVKQNNPWNFCYIKLSKCLNTTFLSFSVVEERKTS